MSDLGFLTTQPSKLNYILFKTKDPAVNPHHKSYIRQNNIMTRKELQDRTRKFHVDVIKICGHFPKNAAGYETATQLIRSAGSVGANYRASVRAKSDNDFIYKIEVVLEEADESHYWLQVVNEAGLVNNLEIDRLINEANELTAIFAATDKTNKFKRKDQKK